MGRLLARRPSASMIVALTALFVALSGGAYAAMNIPANSVGTKQLKKASVTAAKIKKGALLGSAVVGTVAAANNATNASHASSADNATNAAHATSADNATNAGHASTADNATNLGGSPASAFMSSAGVRVDGAADSADIDNFTSPTYTNIIAKTITAPSNGFLMVIGTLSAEDDASIAGPGQLEYRLALDGTGLTSDTFYHEITSDNSTNVRGGSGAVSAVVPVSAGSHTVSLQAREEQTGDYIFGRDVSILFTPNGSASPVPFAPVHQSPSRAGGQG
jgi:hypothetical protein